MAFSCEHIVERLRAHRPEDAISDALERRAAVAMVLRLDERGPHVLLLTRTEREGDRWSGQVALPGGREEDGDEDLLATAMRETREEVGLDLDRTARLLNRLRPIQARAREQLLPMAIVPFVFLRTESAPLEIGEEATEPFWFPLELAASGELASTYRRGRGDEARVFPCWRYEERVIWGLTFEMLRELLRVAFDLERGDE